MVVCHVVEDECSGGRVSSCTRLCIVVVVCHVLHDYHYSGRRVHVLHDEYSGGPVSCFTRRQPVVMFVVYILYTTSTSTLVVYMLYTASTRDIVSCVNVVYHDHQ